MWDLVPQPKNKPGSPALEVLATGPPGKSPKACFLTTCHTLTQMRRTSIHKPPKYLLVGIFFFSFAVLRSIHEEHLSPRGPDYGMGQDTWEANSLEQQLQ